jgi:hypothetical protein
MKEKIFRSHVCQLHNDTPEARMDLTHRIILTATRELDYEALANKYGTILIRPIGSFMPLRGNEILEERYDLNFPIENFADIVICENDEKADYDWLQYLKKTYPDKTIATINYFDLRTEKEVEEYFDKASLVTFSTTFTNMEWFKKLTKIATNQTIIGYCHNADKWKEALTINPNVQIIEKI